MTLLLDNAAIAPLIDPTDFVDVLDSAYRAFAAHESCGPPRIDLQGLPKEDNSNYQLGLAVGIGSAGYAALRIKSDMIFTREVDGLKRKEKYCVQPGTYLGLVMVFDATDGGLKAILHDGLIQKMRVGADSALGIRYMAREDATTLGILGAGGMARTHVAAITAVRPIRKIRIFSPTEANRAAFAREIEDRYQIAAEAVGRPEDVYVGADIVSSCANAIGPMIMGRHLEDGTHITCIGGTLDDEANQRVDAALRFGNATAPVELDSWAVEEECLTFAANGRKSEHGAGQRFARIPRERRSLFGELLADPSRGRKRPEDITFSERGNIHGVQFAAVAGRIYEKARDAGVGIELPDSFFLQSIRN
ncbi:ornithine cyclodeaminase family protein [Microvirga antarctica]|uniref:ornithine cyclodeaminase family protein n=1 Tax=Microvirga antarctica TaxID=2819233 RepID=UPI001B30EDD0|nr:ornithine cyclodeaminase family protein [Microvirga antarctica]